MLGISSQPTLSLWPSHRCHGCKQSLVPVGSPEGLGVAGPPALPWWVHRNCSVLHRLISGPSWAPAAPTHLHTSLERAFPIRGCDSELGFSTAPEWSPTRRTGMSGGASACPLLIGDMKCACLQNPCWVQTCYTSSSSSPSHLWLSLLLWFIQLKLNWSTELKQGTQVLKLD